jgi:hypothetical protein
MRRAEPKHRMPQSRPATVAGYHQDGVALSMSPSSPFSRPLHSESPRPTSSASTHRPSSRATTRPLSRASTTRPASRTGHGAPSKISQRLSSRHMTRIISLSHTLVSQMTGLPPEDEEGDFRALVDFTIRSLDYNTKAAPSSSMNDIAKLLHGSVSPPRRPLPVVPDPGLVVSKGRGSIHRSLGLMPLNMLSPY